MFADQLNAAVDNCPPLANHLADLSRNVWRAWSSGHISDQEAQAVAVRIAERRGVSQPSRTENNERTGFCVARVALPKRRNQQSPDKAASIARRRRLAASGGLPPHLAAHFTISEQAALRIVLTCIRQNGLCAFCLDQIAAMGGCCRTVAKNALRKARLLGLLLVRERRRAGQRSLTNVVSCIMHEVRKWLGMRDKGSAPKGSLKTYVRGGHFSDPSPFRNGAG